VVRQTRWLNPQRRVADNQGGIGRPQHGFQLGRVRRQDRGRAVFSAQDHPRQLD
jgi:hypothetical protein